MIGGLNDTLKSLIPKVENVKMKDFRPINLCNDSYKVITNIISQRLRLRSLMEDSNSAENLYGEMKWIKNVENLYGVTLITRERFIQWFGIKFVSLRM